MISAKINSIQAAVQEGTVNTNSPEAIIKNLSSASKGKKASMVVLNAEPIASIEQVLFALEQSLSAFKSKTNCSKRIELELMMRLMGTTKINKALGLLELRQGANQVVLVGFGEGNVKKAVRETMKAIGLKEKNGLLEANLKKKTKNKGVEDTKEAALERVALTGLV